MNNILRIGLLMFALAHAGAANAQLFGLFGKSHAEKIADVGVSLDRQLEHSQVAALANFLLRAAGPVCAQPEFWRGESASSGLMDSVSYKQVENIRRTFLLQKFGPHPSGKLVVAPPHPWMGLDVAGLKVGDVVLPMLQEAYDELKRATPAEPAATFKERQVTFFHGPIETVASVVRGSSTITVPFVLDSKCAKFEVVEGQGHWADADAIVGVRATGPLLKKLSRVEQAALLAREIGLLMMGPAPFQTTGQPTGFSALLWNKEARMFSPGTTWYMLSADVYAINLLSHLGVSAAEYAKAMTRLSSSEFGSFFDPSRYSITRPSDVMRVKLFDDVVRAETAGEPIPTAEDAAQQAPAAPSVGSRKWVSPSAIQAAFARPAIAKWLPEVREWLRKP